jgi:hypothetical protein
MNTKSIILSIILFISASIGVQAEISMEKAKRVDLILKRIAKKNKKAPFLRKISFSQQELNSYLNYIYIKKNTPEVKKIDLKLRKNNFVSGTMKIKLVGKKYQKVPSFLRDIELEFEGKVECEQYRMRYVFEDIRINGTKFSPELLDEAFNAAQVGYKVKKSMYDWFELMPGIKNVSVDLKKITLFY